RYDASVIDPSSLTDRPSLSSLPYRDCTVLDGFRRAENGSRIEKQGVEFQLNTARWQPLRTSLTVTGAWFRSTYSNSQMLYDLVTDVVGNTPVSDMYVGLYDYLDGRVNEQFNTNFMFDTQIPRWGLIFTTTLQCMWFVKTTRLPQNGVPAYYLDAADGELHPFTESSAQDTYLQFLVKTYNSDNYRTQKIPFAGYLNLKATKLVGRYLRIAMFVNKIIDWLPDYKSNGLTVRRSSDSYFGMEATVTI
ncbi:MAG: outer membrane receptor protein, partial [Muribaculaceae bacterium]|nr:outer membrane receptor protein [Muribaculaceae bacterium]